MMSSFNRQFDLQWCPLNCAIVSLSFLMTASSLLYLPNKSAGNAARVAGLPSLLIKQHSDKYLPLNCTSSLSDCCCCGVSGQEVKEEGKASTGESVKVFKEMVWRFSGSTRVK